MKKSKIKNSYWSPYKPGADKSQKMETFDSFQKSLGGGTKGKYKQIIYFVNAFDQTRMFFSSHKAFKFAEDICFNHNREVTVEQRVYKHSFVSSKKFLISRNVRSCISSFLLSLIEDLNALIYEGNLEDSRILINKLIARLGENHAALSDIIWGFKDTFKVDIKVSI